MKDKEVLKLFNELSDPIEKIKKTIQGITTYIPTWLSILTYMIIYIYNMIIYYITYII